MRNRGVMAWVAAACLVAIPGFSGYASQKNAATRQFQKQLPADTRILQALNRLTYGVRPGDVEAVKSMGLKKWIDRQLHPESIAESAVLEEKLKTLETLKMSGAELVRNYPTPQMVKQMVNGQLPFPADPDRKLMLTKLLAKYEEKQAKCGDATAAPLLTGLLTPRQIRSLRQGTPQARLEAFQALPKEKQDAVIGALPQGLRQGLFAVAPPELRRRIELANGPQQMVARDLSEGKLLRAVYSNRQLDEVLTDFWFNHFNIYLDKGADR